MRGRLQVVVLWCGVTMPSVVLIACSLPSDAASNTPAATPSTTETLDIADKAGKVAQLPIPPTNPQPDPNRDRFLQPTPAPTPLPKDDQPILTPPEPEAEPAQPSVSVFVRDIEVVGSTVFGPEEINPVVQPFEGRSLTLQELRAAADAITQLYLKRGYITSRAVLVNQEIRNGVVQIRVIEGRLERIQVEGNRRLDSDYVRDRIQLGVSTPLNTTKLEEQLRLLQLDPLLEKIEASLQRGTELGESILTVQVAEADPFDLPFSLDNYSPPSIAPERAGIAAVYRNLTGIGDEISASYNVGLNFGDLEQAALNIYDFSYRVPLNPMNGTVQFRTLINNSKVIDPEFADLGIEGESEFYELSYRQPVVRTLREEVALSLGFAFQGGLNLIGNEPFDQDGISRNRVLSFGQDYTNRDTQGVWALRSQFNFGLGILDAVTSGEFFSWSGQAQRVQQLGNDNLLILQGDVQLTPDSLPSFYEFIIGGGQSVRGYRQNALSGDSGFRLSAEGRIPLVRNRVAVPTLQLAPFFDAGLVSNQEDDPEDPFLASVGLGLLWQPIRQFTLRFDYGVPLVDIETLGSRSLQDDGVHFSVVFTP